MNGHKSDQNKRYSYTYFCVSCFMTLSPYILIPLCPKLIMSQSPICPNIPMSQSPCSKHPYVPIFLYPYIAIQISHS